MNAFAVPQHDLVNQVGRVELEKPGLWIDGELLGDDPVVEHAVLVPPDEFTLEQLVHRGAVYWVTLQHALDKVCDIFIYGRPDWLHEVEMLLV